ncbi:MULTISPECIES: gamma carbonic anhydrase family protein [Crateriforma]|nr:MULTISPECIES: gamma carbonic anhydrase family protein [Crateriforma]
MPDPTRYNADLVDPSAFIADTATVVGDVRLGKNVSVWFGAVLRGDLEPIVVGEDSNVQDLSVLHTDRGLPCQIGRRVTIGHSAVVHGATVEDDALIGIGAIVLSGAKVGAGAIVAAGALVTEGAEIPAGRLAVGVPAKVIRDVTEDDRDRITSNMQHYVENGQRFKAAQES